MKRKTLLVSILFSIAITAVSYSFVSQTFGQQCHSSSSQDIDCALNTTAWNTYHDDKLGLSFNYPYEWKCMPKEYIFGISQDVFLSAGDEKFAVFKADNSLNKALNSLGLDNATKAIEGAVQDAGERIIEDANFTKYKIGGEKAGTFLFADDYETGSNTGQVSVVVHEGQFFTLAFSDSYQTFDKPNTQEYY